MKLSIIIPAYNVQEYIIECLESVLVQMSESVEAIILNDGSTDSTLNLITDFIESHPGYNWVLVDKKNGGLSHTRNCGIKIAKGEYVTFLDSDDILMPNYMSSISPYLNDYDIIQYNCTRSESFELNFDDEWVTGKSEISSSYTEILKESFRVGLWYLCTRVFKKSLFDDFLLPLNRHYEDIATTPILYLRTSKIATVPKCLYGYRYNPNSITSNKSIKDVEDVFFALKRIASNLDINDSLYIEKKSAVDSYFLKTAGYFMYINSRYFPQNFNVTKSGREYIKSYTSMCSKLKCGPDIMYLYFPRFLWNISKFKSFIMNKG